ncbi:5-dehydro-2-deoxygluconokinase [Crateriforma conspicua]|uniref:5-dehydro-2-deoxygluconokinase n=1 Tax=Crateriforma conspicua TaxID=2527996 RepID=A0A5C5Y7M2_9PLAN|nr:5-dehydro-2-deoxygluconokinase [Crateriforma conspicua]
MGNPATVAVTDQSERNAEPVDMVGIGVSVWDQIFLVDRYPDEDSVVRSDHRLQTIGGGITVAMATAAKLGCNAVLLDRLGHDDASTQIIESLRRAGVNDGLLQRCQGATASVASIWSAEKGGTRTIVFSPGRDIDLRWEERYVETVAAAKLLHLSGRHLDASLQAIAIAKRSGTRVSYDGGAYRYRDSILPLVRQSDILIVARQFAEAMLAASKDGNTDVDQSLSPESLATHLFDTTSAGIVGVTAGVDGSWFVSAGGPDCRGESWHQPAFSVDKVVDTTGCGDVFHGAFLAAIARGQDPKSASRCAAHVAAINATAVGGLAFETSQLDIRLMGWRSSGKRF